MQQSLKRTLKLPTVTFFGIGAILGAGIYVLIGEVVATAGHFAPLSFLLAALIAGFSAFSYSELSSAFPRSAGAAIYINEAFGVRWLTLLTGLLVVFTGVVSAATMATGVVGYVQLFVQIPSFAVILLFVGFIGAIAFWGIEESAWLVTVITLVEIAGLVFVIAVAGDDIMQLPARQWPPVSVAGNDMVMGILLGSFLAFYAYIGFEDMVNIAEEIKQPEKVLPTAILLAVLISTLLYAAICLAALSVLEADVLGQSSAPLADVVTAKGYSSQWIGMISVVAVVNGAIVQLIMASRVIYGMAASGLLPTGLAEINRYTRTPGKATLLSIAVILLLALIFPLSSLAQMTSFIVLSVFAMVNMALIRINGSGSPHGGVHYPRCFPYIGALLCIGMLLTRVVYMVFDIE